MEYEPTPINSRQDTAPRKHVFIHLPFLGDILSGSFRLRLNRAVASCYPAARVIMRPSVTRSFYSRIKDELPLTSLASVVCLFESDCFDRYAGRTEATLATRIAQLVPR